jgi:aminopeptidase N
VNGESAEYSRDGQELSIKPNEALERGESFLVEIHYSGTPQEYRSVAYPVSTGWIQFDSGSFVYSGPDGAANFFPTNDHPLDKASYTFQVSVPKPYEVAANGVLVEIIDNSDSQTFVFEAQDEMASYLVTINIDDFNIETTTSPNGILVRNYYSSSLSQDYPQIFSRQGEMLDFYSELFGPYPFEVYGAVMLDTRTGGAMECQTLSLFGTDFINPKSANTSELIVAHELAHQWFGNSLSVADWSEIWLNEGFATYAEGLWLEHLEGQERLDDWVKKKYSHILAHNWMMVSPGKPKAEDLFNTGVYGWGALTLHALRVKVGDDIFFEILKTYYQRYQGGNVNTADFIATAEDVSGMELDAFFELWLYSDTLPPIPEMGL